MLAGGAAIVASHIRSLGANCTLVSVVGNDFESKFIKDLLKSQSINDQLIVDESRPTTFKKRYIVENQKLFRVSKLEEKSVAAHIEELIIKKLDETLRRLMPWLSRILFMESLHPQSRISD